MDEFQIVAEIDRPAEAVFAALLNTENYPDWNSGVHEVRRTSTGPIEVGSELVFVGRFLGRSYESTAECTDLVANEKFTTKSKSGPFHLEIENLLESVDAKTKLTTNFRGESRGFFKLAEPVVVRLAKKQFDTSTENLKALLEANAL